MIDTVKETSKILRNSMVVIFVGIKWLLFKIRYLIFNISVQMKFIECDLFY